MKASPFHISYIIIIKEKAHKNQTQRKDQQQPTVDTMRIFSTAAATTTTTTTTMSSSKQRREIPPRPCISVKDAEYQNYLAFQSLITQERLARYKAANSTFLWGEIIDEIEDEMKVLNLVHVMHKGGPELDRKTARRRVSDALRVKVRKSVSDAFAPAPAPASAPAPGPVPVQRRHQGYSNGFTINDPTIQLPSYVSINAPTLSPNDVAIQPPAPGGSTESLTHNGANICSVAVPPAAAATCPAGDIDAKINIRVCNQEGEQVYFRIKPTTKFSKLFKSYANREKAKSVLYLMAIGFVFDGKRIQEDQTPQMLGMEDDGQIDVVLLAPSQQQHSNGAIPPGTCLQTNNEIYRNNHKILFDLLDLRIEQYCVAGARRRNEIVTETLKLMDEKGIFFSDEFDRPLLEDKRKERLRVAYRNYKGRLLHRNPIKEEEEEEQQQQDDDSIKDVDDDEPKVDESHIQDNTRKRMSPYKQRLLRRNSTNNDEADSSDDVDEPKEDESNNQDITRKRKSPDTPSQDDRQRKVLVPQGLNNTLNTEAASSVHDGTSTNPPELSWSPDTPSSQDDGQRKLPAPRGLNNDMNAEVASSVHGAITAPTKLSWFRGLWNFATTGHWNDESRFFVTSRKPQPRTIIFCRKSNKNEQLYENTVVVNPESEGLLSTYLFLAKAKDQFANVFGMTRTLKQKVDAGIVYRFYEGKVGKFPEDELANMEVSNLFGLDDDNGQPLKLRIGYEKVNIDDSADLNGIE